MNDKAMAFPSGFIEPSTGEFHPGRAAQIRIRTIDAGSAHRAFTAAQNCSVTALVSSVMFQPFVWRFPWPTYARSEASF